MKTKLLTILVFLVSIASTYPAIAGKSARSGAADARIKTFTYSENDVYRLRGHYGYSTVIEFSTKEIIESISIGDSEAWQTIRSGRPNILFIKPILDNAQTNMTVLTSKRMYTFELTASRASSHQSENLAFRIKFIYANETDGQLARFSSGSRTSYDPFQGMDGDSFNFEYSYSGSKRLRPTKAFDDGVFTYLSFPKFETMPAVFEVNEDGTERLVNFNIKGKYLVVSSIGRQFTLRDGNTATCIFNDSYPKNTGHENKVTPIAELNQKESQPKEEAQQFAENVPLPDKKPSNTLAENEGSAFTKLASYFSPTPVNVQSLNE